MRLASIGAVVAVLGLAAIAGVGFSGCGGTSSAQLVWLHPTGSPVPAAHTFVRCTESGKNTPHLDLAATNLGPGDGCLFTASLANVGNRPLEITVATTESTPIGDPSFSTCFGYTLSSGPPSGKISGGGSYPYTVTIEMLGSAPSYCASVVGTVHTTFTGGSTCSSPDWGRPPPASKLGPGANLQHADLQGLNLSGYDMAGDNLQGANLDCDDLAGTNLAGANLQGATFTESDLAGASLVGANLQSAQLVDTTLTGADFQGANLQNANFQGAVVTGLSGRATNFDGANLQGINLGGVSATGYITTSGANIHGAVNVASCSATSGTAVYCDEL
jgi:hypothetical protein